MQTAVRIFAMCVAITGLVTSSMSPASANLVPSHLTAAASGPGPLSLPIPTCEPSLPTCGGGVTIGINLNF